jgi:hypothetical protein
MYHDRVILCFLPGLCQRAKILKFSITNINGTFAFASPLNPTPRAKAKEPFIRTVIKIMFYITPVRFILTNLLQVIIYFNHKRHLFNYILYHCSQV